MGSFATYAYTFNSQLIEAYEKSQSEFQKYKQAEEKGRLVKLPCTPDKKCYTICQLNCEYMDCLKQDENGNCEIDCPNIIVEVNLEKLLLIDLLGLRLFFSREEAEEALKKSAYISKRTGADSGNRTRILSLGS